jgi:hypothetical protein
MGTEAHAARHGCYNRQVSNTLVVQVGWTRVSNYGMGYTTREPLLKEIPSLMSKDCKYSKEHYDPKCSGCLWNTTNLKSNP